MDQVSSPRLRAGALRGLTALVLLVLLAACNKTNTPHAQSLDPKALLELRFVTPGQSPQVDLSPVKLGNVGQANVDPLKVVQLDDTHAVLLTHARTGQDCHACPGVMGAYFYERDTEGWRLSKILDALLATGVDDQLGSVAVTALEGAHHAATIDWGSCWQGSCGTWLEVVSLQPNMAQALGGIAISADNEGAYGACSALDAKPASQSKAAETDDEEMPVHSQVCYQIDSKWHFQGKRLLIDFTGRVREEKNSELQPLRKIQQRAVYEMQADALKLMEGENPVPGF